MCRQKWCLSLESYILTQRQWEVSCQSHCVKLEKETTTRKPAPIVTPHFLQSGHTSSNKVISVKSATLLVGEGDIFIQTSTLENKCSPGIFLPAVRQYQGQGGFNVPTFFIMEPFTFWHPCHCSISKYNKSPFSIQSHDRYSSFGELWLGQFTMFLFLGKAKIY